MHKSLLGEAAIIILTVAGLAVAQEQQKATAQYAATVRETKGRCVVRNNESAKPTELKVGDQLHAGQELQCASRSRVKIRFLASGADKEIDTVRPDWYIIPNVPAAIPKSAAKIAGRAKGRLDPAIPEPSPTVEARQAIVAPQVTANVFDAAEMYWKTRPKRYLLVAASQTQDAETKLPFTSIDAKAVAATLTKLGYEPLGTGLLEGANATGENFVAELEKIRTLPPNALVIVYYSGHASADPSGKDLWLQLYGQKKFGEHYGLSIDNLLGAARGTTYKGELSLILDTCFSGAAANSTQLKESENTVVVASSSYQQPSVSMVAPNNTEMSAFTYYFIQGLTDDWTRVDGDRDGIITYPDLAIYIGNRLTEKFRDRALLGPMQPQLFGGFNKNWVGYDAGHAQNFETETRRAVQLERSSQLQDPDVTSRMLDQITAANADSYLRALKAADDKKFEDAMELLDAAEKEGRVSPAQIAWGRAYVKMEQNQFGAVREWLDKAVELSRDNPSRDLISYDGAINFMVGNWGKAEELLKRALLLPAPDHAAGNEDDELSPAMILSVLSMLNLLQGDKTEADLYLKRLKEIDPKTLSDDDRDGLDVMVPMLEIISHMMQDKMADARQKIDALRQSKSYTAATGEWKGIFDRLLETFATALNSGQGGKLNPSVRAEHFRDWDNALQKRDVNTLLFLLNQNVMLTASDNSPTEAREFDDLLARTVKLAEERKNEKPTNQTRVIDGVQVTEIAGDEKEFVLQAAMLLTAAGQSYAMKGDTASAERVLKEGIALDLQQSGGAAISFSAVLQLADLYKQARRYTEAETQLKNLLKNLSEPLGEENLLACMAQGWLGNLYEDWNRPNDAELAYREALRLSLLLDKDGIIANEARKTLADFLAATNNNEEASQLYEVAIRSIEQNSGRSAVFGEDLGRLYFALGKVYYALSSFEAAEKTLAKTYKVFSDTSDPKIVNLLDCLEWQWATAIVLKKQTDADALYKRMLDLIEPELAKPKPDDSLGEELRQLGYWYRSWDWEKSEHLFEVALKMQQKVFGADSWQVADVWLGWSALKEARGQLAMAVKYQETALALYEKQTPPLFPRISYAKYLKAFNHYERGEFVLARTLFDESTKLLDKVEASNEDFFRHQWSKYMLGATERRLQNYDRARSILTSVLTVDQNIQPVDTDYLLADVLELAVIARLQGNNSEAHDWLARASKYLDGVPANKWLRRRGKLAHERGMLALGQKNTKEAEDLLRDAVSFGSKDNEMDPFTLSEWMDDLAQLLRQRKKDKEAVELEKNAKQIRDRLKSGN
jgi:hypothetical protein